MLVPRQLGARCKPDENGPTFGFLVLPDSFLLNPSHRLGPGDFAQVEILRGWRPLSIARGFDATGDNREYRCTVFTAYGVHATVGTVADVARSGGSMFVGNRTFDHVEEFVAGVAMHGQNGTGFKTGQLSPPLSCRIRKEYFCLYIRNHRSPFNIVDADYLR